MNIRNVLLSMRSARKLEKNAKYHVTARSNHKEMNLEDPKVKEIFLGVIHHAHKKFSFKIENFVIMGNHIHFIIYPQNDSSLSQIMKWILGVFAMKYNKMFDTWGHFWGDRFFSRIIKDIWEYIKIFEYIDNNPVRSKKVENPSDWEWGGLHHHRLRRKDIVAELARELMEYFPGHFSV